MRLAYELGQARPGQVKGKQGQLRCPSCFARFEIIDVGYDVGSSIIGVSNYNAIYSAYIRGYLN